MEFARKIVLNNVLNGENPIELYRKIVRIVVIVLNVVLIKAITEKRQKFYGIQENKRYHLFADRERRKCDLNHQKALQKGSCI